MTNQVSGERFRSSPLPAGRVAVMFTADWCGYCHRFDPHFKRLREGWVVDISDQRDPLWDDYRVRLVPTVILFEEGIEVRRWEGVLGAGHMEQIEEALRSGTDR